MSDKAIYIITIAVAAYFLMASIVLYIWAAIKAPILFMLIPIIVVNSLFFVYLIVSVVKEWIRNG